MAEYQNIFTQVQIRAPALSGSRAAAGRRKTGSDGVPSFNHLARRFIGDAQIGPDLSRLLTGTSVLCSAGSSPSRSSGSTCGPRSTGIRSSSCASCRGSPSSRRPRSAGLCMIFPRCEEGGWWLMAGFFLTTSCMLWWVRIYRRAEALGMGTHVAWAFALGHLALCSCSASSGRC